MKHQEEQERDELRARFTRWMEVTLYRARINYLSRQAREQERFFLVEEIPEKYLPDFIYVTPEDRTSYMMIGNYDRCLKKMEKKMRKKQ